MIYLLGIDIGTSSCKAVLFRPDGTEAVSAMEEYPVYYPTPDSAEQDAEMWYAAVCRGVRRILDTGTVRAAEIAAVGIDGQSWSCILTDRAGNALARTPIWFDRRAQAECATLARTVGEEAVFAICGNPLQPTYTTPKELWFKTHAPALYARTRWILQSNSYIVMKLTGQFTQDRSQGYGHFFYDIRKRAYDADMARALGVDLSRYPDLRECNEIVGMVTDKAAAETGLLAGTPVAAGGLDAAAGTLGTGAYRNGHTHEMSGTSGGMSLCLDQPITHPALISCSHVVPGMHLLQGGTSGGGGSMKWFADEFGDAFPRNGAKSVFAAVDLLAETAPKGSGGVLFLPYMAGERCPIWDSDAKGMFFGLSYAVGKAELARAVMEGAAFSLRHCLDIAEACGARVEILYPSGGASRSRLWMQIKADITGKTFVIPRTESAVSLGAAMLAGIGAGIYRDFEDAVTQTVKLGAVYEPSPDAEEIYSGLYRKYLALYTHTKELMRS